MPTCVGNSIDFEIGGALVRSSSIFVGSSACADMTRVAMTFRGEADPSNMGTFTIPASTTTLSMNTPSGCTSDFYVLRTRVYYADPSSFGTTAIRWDIGNGFENVPIEFLLATTSADDCVAPTAITPVATECRFAFRDANGDVFERTNAGGIGAG